MAKKKTKKKNKKAATKKKKREPAKPKESPDDWVTLAVSVPRWMRDYVKEVAVEEDRTVSATVRQGITLLRVERGDAEAA